VFVTFRQRRVNWTTRWPRFSVFDLVEVSSILPLESTGQALLLPTVIASASLWHEGCVAKVIAEIRMQK